MTRMGKENSSGLGKIKAKRVKLAEAWGGVEGGRERSLREESGRGGPGPGLGDEGTSGLQKPQVLQLDSPRVMVSLVPLIDCHTFLLCSCVVSWTRQKYVHSSSLRSLEIWREPFLQPLFQFRKIRFSKSLWMKCMLKL